MESPKDFAKQLQVSIQAIFPRSLVTAHVSSRFTNSITIGFTIGTETEWAHGIELNDFARHVIIIFLNDGGPMPETMPDKAKVEGSPAGSFCIKPKESWLYCSRHKAGWRDFSGDAKTIKKRITAYFEKLKSEISANIDNLLPADKALALTKIFHNI